MRMLITCLTTASLVVFAASCAEQPAIVDGNPATHMASSAKADDGTGRSYEVLLTSPHCDICSAADKAYLKPRSNITKRVVELIDAAQRTIDVAQFTFSVTDIEAALLRAHHRGVTLRVAMNGGQQQDANNVSNRLKRAGLNLKFVDGREIPNKDYSGLMHSKFMIVDATTVVHGSNNWSSTGTSINEENTIVITAPSGDTMLAGFSCHFEAIWNNSTDDSARCSNSDVTFSPSTAPIAMLKEGIRGATQRIDVLMHHMLFKQLIKELAKAAENGVLVRVVVNAADRHEVTGSSWDRLLNAGGLVRFKQTNSDAYQLMHNKLAIFDGKLLINGSGNWSGSAFFNNYEFYVRYHSRYVVGEFVTLFERLWSWSLTADSLDHGLTAAAQDANETQIFFGNLHAHHAAHAGEHPLDDGVLERHDEHGNTVDVGHEAPDGQTAIYAFEYARDHGKLDFMALTPHVVDDDPELEADVPNMNRTSYAYIVNVANQITDMSGGQFVAIPGMEWNTNSQGNHVTVLGTKQLCKVMRGRFDLFYEDYLPSLTHAGEKPLLIFNHPRTFRRYTETLQGNWDQVYGANLADIPKTGQRTKKFNDFGLDDYPPLNNVLGTWIAGHALPDEQVVSETLMNVAAASRPYVRSMEVLMGRGKELRSEIPQNPSLNTDPETGVVSRMTRVHHDWDYYLRHGFRLAPSAPHDNHYANWGTGHTSRTGIIAHSLTEDRIMHAIDQRAMYASEDQNMKVRYYANGRVPMGSEMTNISGSVTLNMLMSDPDYSGTYQVSIWQGRVGGAEVVETSSFVVQSDAWVDTDVFVSDPGVHFAYLEIQQVGTNRMAWSSPIWINRPAQ